ncbi:MAG: sulfite exporter TauE/SafE family protein [Pseudomonadota bacterium]
MNTDTVFLILGGLAGGFINGFSGTGTALFALGFLLVVLEPAQAVAIVALLSVLSGLQGVWVVRRSIRSAPRRLLRFLLPGLIGVPLGALLLNLVDTTVLRLLVATFLVTYGVFFGFRAALPRAQDTRPKADMAIGFVSGTLGGLASLSGALPAIWLSMRAWPKADIRGVMQGFNIVILSCTAVILALRGTYTPDVWAALALVLPAGLIASVLGIYAFKRVSDDQFRRTLILLCLAMGLGIFAHAIAG